MSFRKNATTLVIKNPRAPKRSRTATMKVMVPRRSQRGFLNQTDTGRGPEKKNQDLIQTLALPLLSAFSTPALINGIGQGTGSNQRIGRKVLLKAIQMRYTAQSGVIAGGNVPMQNRIIVFYDKQSNGAAPAITDVVVANSFVSPLNLNNSDRFVILFDELTESAQGATFMISGSRYTKCNLEQMFVGNNALIADIAGGAVFIMAANNSDPVVGQATSTYVHTRVRYIDF